MMQNTILALHLFSLYLISEGFVFYVGPNQLERQFQTLSYLIVFSIVILIQ